jgi:hypothetical protein
MDLDAGEDATDVGDETAKKMELAHPQPVRDALHPDSVEPRITENNLSRAARGRVSLENHFDILPERLEHGWFPVVLPKDKREMPRKDAKMRSRKGSVHRGDTATLWNPLRLCLFASLR